MQNPVQRADEAHPLPELTTPDPDITGRMLGKCCCPRHSSKSLWWCPSYLADWFVLAVIAIGVIIEISLWKPTIRPYQPAVLLSNGLWNYNDNVFQNPFRDNTFSEVTTFLISILAPCCFALLYHIVRRFGPWKDRSLHDLHHFMLGMCTAFVLAYFTWIPINRSIGALRPDFWWRLNGGNVDDIEQGRQSFPSGHALSSFLGLGFFMFWMCGKFHVYHSSRGNLWRFFIAVILPMALAVAQAVSRVTDYRHHPVDVLAGAILGTGAAFVGYHLNYPPNFAPDCHLPKNRKQAYYSNLLSGIAASKKVHSEPDIHLQPLTCAPGYSPAAQPTTWSYPMDNQYTDFQPAIRYPVFYA